MSTGYSAGLRKDRITIINRTQAETSKFGIDGNGIEWEDACCVWANVTWAKGVRTLNVGAIDAYGVVLVRMNWNGCVTNHSRIRYNGQVYQILPETFHPDKQGGTIQFNAQLVVNE